VVDIAIPTFETAFPNTQGLFLFDHATSHTADASNALRVNWMNLAPGGKQPLLCDTWFYRPDGVMLCQQQMVFGLNDLMVPEKWRGNAKGAQVVCEERGIWPEGGLRLDCASQQLKKDRQDSGTNCCARRLLSNQPDF
jgi:hypothetical protein